MATNGSTNGNKTVQKRGNRLYPGYQVMLDVRPNEMVVLAGTAMAAYTQRVRAAVMKQASGRFESSVHHLQGQGTKNTPLTLVGEKPSPSLVLGPFEEDVTIGFNFEHKKSGADYFTQSTVGPKCFSPEEQLNRENAIHAYWVSVEDGGNSDFMDSILSITLIASSK